MKKSKTKKRLVDSFMLVLMAFGVSGCSSSNNALPVQPEKGPSTHLLDMGATQTEVPKKSNVISNSRNKGTPINVPILEYHNSAYVKNWPWSLNPGQFEKEMEWLHKNQFHSVTLQEVYNAYRYGAKLPSRPFVITFDDGHRSNLTLSGPILKKYGFKATEFVVTGAIGKKGFLSKQDLISMEASGTWDIESHSVHHPHLSKIPEKKMINELTQSKKVLTKLLGHPVNFFCYPYGDYNTKVVLQVQKAGYLLATTVHHGYANPVAQGPLTLPRLSVHQGLPLSTFQSWFQPSLHKQLLSTKK